MSPTQFAAEEGRSTSVKGGGHAYPGCPRRDLQNWLWVELREWGDKGCESSSQTQEGAMDTSSPSNAVLQACLSNFTQQFLFAAKQPPASWMAKANSKIK